MKKRPGLANFKNKISLKRVANINFQTFATRKFFNKKYYQNL